MYYRYSYSRLEKTTRVLLFLLLLLFFFGWHRRRTRKRVVSFPSRLFLFLSPRNQKKAWTSKKKNTKTARTKRCFSRTTKARRRTPRLLVVGNASSFACFSCVCSFFQRRILVHSVNYYCMKRATTTPRVCQKKKRKRTKKNISACVIFCVLRLFSRFLFLKVTPDARAERESVCVCACVRERKREREREKERRKKEGSRSNEKRRKVARARTHALSISPSVLRYICARRKCRLRRWKLHRQQRRTTSKRGTRVV